MNDDQLLRYSRHILLDEHDARLALRGNDTALVELDIDGETVQSESIRVFTADGFTSYQLPGVGGTTHVAEAGGASHLFTGPGGNVPEDDVTGAFILNYANTGLIRLERVANTTSGNNNNGIFTGIDGDLSLIGGNTGAFDDPVDVLGAISGDVVGDDSQDLPGATVVLKDAAGNDVDHDPNTPGVQPYTDVTDSFGVFLFTGLPPGEYQVWLVLPAGYLAVSDSDGGNPLRIGDVATVPVDPGVETDAGGFVTESIPAGHLFCDRGRRRGRRDAGRVGGRPPFAREPPHGGRDQPRLHWRL